MVYLGNLTICFKPQIMQYRVIFALGERHIEVMRSITLTGNSR